MHVFFVLQVGDRDLLEDVSWRLMPGSRVGLVGANGAGKSTLLRCLTGVRQVRTCWRLMGPRSTSLSNTASHDVGITHLCKHGREPVQTVL